MLLVYTRHYPPCKQEQSNYRRCKCSKCIQGALDGHFVRQNAKTRSWEKTQAHARHMEDIADPASLASERITVESAVDVYLADAKARELARSTQSKLQGIFQRQLLDWTKQEGLLAAIGFWRRLFQCAGLRPLIQCGR